MQNSYGAYSNMNTGVAATGNTTPDYRPQQQLPQPLPTPMNRQNHARRQNRRSQDNGRPTNAALAVMSHVEQCGPVFREEARQLYAQIMHPKSTTAEGSPLACSSTLVSSPPPGKTPVSILQEILVKRAITPKYELLQIEGAIHEPAFSYRVSISAELAATGTGRSKKIAKHAAAKRLLEKIIGDKLDLCFSGDTVDTDEIERSVSASDRGGGVNPIGILQEFCVTHRCPPPNYRTINEVGLPHERRFVVACQVGQYEEVGHAISKKVAKKLAAQKIWFKLQNLPDTVNFNDTVDNQLATRLSDLHMCLINAKLPAPNSMPYLKVSQFHKQLKNAKGPLVEKLQGLNFRSLTSAVHFLANIGNEQKFEVTYVDIEEKSYTNQYQCLVQLSIVPLAVCFGKGETRARAKEEAAINALEYLCVLTKNSNKN